jgi:hypothetical protein
LRDHAEEQAKVKIEIPACPDALFGVDGYDAEPYNGVSDYCLYRENGVLSCFSMHSTIGLIDVFMRSNQARRVLFS